MMPTPSLPDTSTNSITAALLSLLALALWLLMLFALRACLVNEAFAPYVGCDACFVVPSLAHDSSLFAAALVLAGLALVLRGNGWRLLLLIAMAGLMLVSAVDVLVFRSLTHRLLWGDVLKFIRDFSTVGDIGAQSLQGWARTIAVVVAVVGVMAWCAAIRHLRAAPRLGAVTLLAAVVIALTGALARSHDPEYVNADISFQNLIEVNLAQSIDTPYSAEFIEKMKAVPPLPPVCADGQQRRLDVVLVMVESLSGYHSRLYGGSVDAVPKLDALAPSGRWFADFHANGFTTDGGMIALLTGLAPIPVLGRYASMDAFAGYADRAHSVPALLAQHGYYSAFFTTGDLGFVDKNRWLADIGFDHQEGAESDFYAGKSRGIFGAARDSLLFDRFSHWYDNERDQQRPFFATLLTVTTHPPFIDPERGVADEQGVFREVDDAIAALHARLRANGFFNNGVLLVTGDHRAMTPLHASEYQRDGAAAFSRVPMYLFGPDDWQPSRIDGKFQHSDLLPSLDDLVSSRSCHHAGQGLLLRDRPQPAQFALHARGMPRDRIDVHVDGASDALILAGDRSHWSGTPPADADAIAAMIHLQRATRRSSKANLLEALIEMRTPAASK